MLVEVAGHENVRLKRAVSRWSQEVLSAALSVQVGGKLLQIEVAALDTTRVLAAIASGDAGALSLYLGEVLPAARAADDELTQARERVAELEGRNRPSAERVGRGRGRGRG